MSKVVRIALEDLIIFEGRSTKTNKDYAFVKIDRRKSNDTAFIADLKAAGVRVNGNVAASSNQPTVIEEVK